MPGVRPRLATPARPAETFRVDHEPAVDVGLRVGLDSLRLVPTRRVDVATSTGGRERALGETAAAITARVDGDRWMFDWQQSGGERLATELDPADTLWLGGELTGESTRKGGFVWEEKTWRGRMKLFLGPQRRLTLVSRVPLETYLMGVVPTEIGGLAENLFQAGRAQAIAARSYTLFYRGRRGDEGFDLYGSVEDQVYGPVESERPLATRCVEGTRGLVALWDETPIRANYYSTCGGITADVWEAWPADPLPYLVTHRDAGRTGDYCATSSQYRWREEWSADDFMKILATFAPPEGVSLPEEGLGELVDVRVDARSRSGRVWRLVVETTTGEVTIPAHQLRRVVRRSGDRHLLLRSNLFKIDVRRDRQTKKPLAVVAAGGGSGHGVGLCQTGAKGMALEGVSGERILQHYYPGVELRRLY